MRVPANQKASFVSPARDGCFARIVYDFGILRAGVEWCYAVTGYSMILILDSNENLIFTAYSQKMKSPSNDGSDLY